MLNANSARNSSRSPFTAIQWQELEHQALIFKYMISGVPIPPELLYSVKRSLESSLASRLFPHQQPIGWGCFQMGFGRKIDPEPGRCRRTDGKKWRCSKEAYPDSKYCERHMHRGRNRSRKPVELITTSSTASSSTTTTSSSSSTLKPTTTCMITSSGSTVPINPSSYSFAPLSCSSFEASKIQAHNNTSTATLLNPFLYPHSSSSSSSRPPGSGYSPHQNSTTHNLFMDSGSSSYHHHHHPDRDYRYFQGMREGVDERAFFPEHASARNARALQDSSYQHLSMSSSYKGDCCYSLQSAHHFQSLADHETSKDQQQQQQQQQHCFVLGSDFRSTSSSSSASRPIKLEKDSETQKPLHHFFGGDWPPKNTDSWLDLASSSR